MAFSARVSNDVMAQINVTPLVDVLLVLLIIFMITAPIVTHKTTLDLPQGGKSAAIDTTEPIRISIQSDGSVFWNDTPVSETQLSTQLSIAALRTSPPALHITATDGATYQTVARVLAEAKAQGLERIDFVSER
jgi:biopolymer transport protein ExbD